MDTVSGGDVMQFEFKIEGLQELTKTIQDLSKSLDPDKSEPVILKGAKVIGAEVRGRAPKGPTGNLKKSVKVKTLKRFSSKQPAPAIVAIDRKKAPHAHLVEYGHALVRGGKVIGHVPAHPFFRPGIDAKAGEALKQIEAGLTKLVEGAAK